ncbi:helix-turn-helix domain-containing protein [Rhizohabitans arisaemae]|uniref:helix-turn-helix domain-containing protein n=1 Tax=Rhizohabitans arisaemae TaxID=2720610 RepID=UPI0024B0ABD4|nr:helix-turn-helix domain-containing protein [Rhizohabitans arisaemae]
MDPDEASTTGRTLADRLNYLFATVRESGRREYSNDEVASAVGRDQEVTISASYLWYLRTGQRDNPTLKHITALARFFGVPVAYFFDEAVAVQVESELALVAAMRDARVRDLALRADGLSAASLDSLREVVARVRELEGLPPRQDG